LKSVSKSRHGALSQMNITPLLDLVFVLLVIFIITTPQLLNNIEMTLPDNQPREPQTQKNEPLRILVLGGGRISMNGGQYNVESLKTELAGRKAANTTLPVIVQGADAAPYQDIVDVLELLNSLGITQSGLSTAAPGV
jgi:biopolymer transport protein ExbD